MKKITFAFITLVLVIIASSRAFAQTDNAGSGRAVSFDGVDDYIDLGNIYDDLQLPLTISAWVYKSESDKYILPIFVSQDNGAVYNGFWFCLSATNLFFEYGDGRGEQSASFRRGKSATIPNLAERWIYVSAVVKGASNIELYANGYNMGGEFQGSSTQPMASNYPDDVAKIGYFYTNSTVHRFEGLIDEVRIWDRALTEEELRQNMCRRLPEDEPGLIGHWNFDEMSGDQIVDTSPKKFHGTLRGNPTRVFSGAPVGDESAFLYTTDWEGKTLSQNTLTISKISGDPFGVHIYSVNATPSQAGGLNAEDVQLPYNGVFLADQGGSNTFDFNFSENACTFQRNDNSESQWVRTESSSGIQTRQEIIRILEEAELGVELGGPVTVCDEGFHYLQPEGTGSAETFLWNTGQTTREITVTASGVYWVEVRDGCQADVDSVHIIFSKTPPAFSLGEDEVLCASGQRTLTVELDMSDLEYTWQDGSIDKSFVADDAGTYWVKAENACGVSADSLIIVRKEFSDLEYYNFMSPDTGDDWNQFFCLDPRLAGSTLRVFNRWGKQVYASNNYHNDWDAAGLASGMYFYTVSNECIQSLKGVLTIAR